MQLSEVTDRLTKWHVTRHGSEQPDMVRTALKGCEEMGEIAKAVLRNDTANIQEEIADVFFILLHLSRGVGVDLLDLAAKKLPVIEDRLKRGHKCESRKC